MEHKTSEKNLPYYLKRATGIILLLALSFTFFYSAYTKSGIEWNPTMVADAHNYAKATGHWWSFPVGIFQNLFVETPSTANAFDNFQWTFLDLGINSIFATAIIARLMIGFELVLGFFLLFHIFLRKFTYKTVIAILGVFIVYLLIVIIKEGNTGNCGCFGNKLTMSPLAAIGKNVGMIAATVLLMFIYPVKPYKYQEYLCMLLLLIGFSLPFVSNPINTSTHPEVYKDKPVNFDLLYKNDFTPPAELKKGKHIIAFMSLTCPHCKKAAYLLQIIHHQHPDIPIYLILAGHENFRKQFFADTHAESLPHFYCEDINDFTTMSGPGVPAIYWVNDGRVEYKSVYAYYQLDPNYMEQWLKAPPLPPVAP